MILIIGGLLLILAGIALVFLKKKPTQVPGTKTDNDSDKEKDKQGPIENRYVSSIPLSELEAPSNFPEEVVFYFGSQTGTAEKFCGVLEKEVASIRGVPSARVIDFEDFKPEVFTKHQLMFVCIATHYEGDPCDNTKKFFKWFKEQKKNKDPTLLKGMKFGVFGLGDTSYEQFNVLGKMFNETFEELGAERIYKYGEGNAEGNHTEDNFNEWKAEIWVEVMKHYKSLPQSDSIVPRAAQIQLTDAEKANAKYPLAVELLNDDQDFQVGEVAYELTIKQYMTSFDLPIKHITQLRQNLDEGSTIEVSYDLKGSGLTYQTATNLALFPENTLEDVQACARRLGYNLSQRFAFKPNPASNKKGTVKHPFQTPIMVQDALTKFVDLKGQLSKSTLKELSTHCSDESEQKKLLELSDPKNKELFQEEIEKPLVGLLDILNTFKSISLPMEAFFQISDRIKPRYYTIASSSVKYPDEVRIAVSLTVDTVNKPQKQEKWGLTSKFLQNINEQVQNFTTSKITNRIFIKDSNFNQPADRAVTPIIMVGPGTGVVPFIGFMQERNIAIKEQGQKLAPAYLFFGCRKANSDFIYKEEILQYESNGVIDKLYNALSRESNQEKTYVQDLMAKEKDLIVKVLSEQKGHIYLCGSTRMGMDVQNLLKELFGEDGFKALEKEKRLVKELWG